MTLREFAKTAARDYKHEYCKFHSSRKAKAHRAARNKARRHSCLKVGDPREVDHKVPLSHGGSDSDRNTRVVSFGTNRKDGPKKKG